MVEYTYDPSKGQQEDLGLPNISKLASFKVHLPYRDNVLWPQKCVMCEAPATKTGSVSTNYKSGQYVVAKKTSTMKFSGVPYCNKCHRRHTFSPLQIIVMILGPLIGFIIAGLVGTFLIESICVGCSIWIMVSILFLLAGVFLVGGGFGSPPVDVEVKTEEKVMGNKRPVQLDFSFRNRRYSEDFRELNMPRQERHDLW